MFSSIAQPIESAYLNFVSNCFAMLSQDVLVFFIVFLRFAGEIVQSRRQEIRGFVTKATVPFGLAFKSEKFNTVPNTYIQLSSQSPALFFLLCTSVAGTKQVVQMYPSQFWGVLPEIG